MVESITESGTPEEPLNPEESEVDLDAASEHEKELADQYYDLYRTAFEVQLTDSPAQAVNARHNHIETQFCSEIQFARSALEEVPAAYEARRGWMNLLVVSFVRAYRAIDWYQAELGQAVADAISQPFTDYLRADSPIKARDFFAKGAMIALRDKVLDVAFSPVPFVANVKTFFDAQRDVRNRTAHGVHVPTWDECRSCVSGAIEIHNLADRHFNPVATVVIPPLSEIEVPGR